MGDLICNTLMLITDLSPYEYFYSTQTDTLYRRRGVEYKWRVSCGAGCKEVNCPIHNQHLFTFTEVGDGIPNVYPEGHTPPDKEYDNPPIQNLDRLASFLEESKVKVDEAVALELTEMNQEQLIEECTRRKKVCECMWMGITKHFKAHGFSKVLAYVNNRRHLENEAGFNTLGDQWFLFQQELSKDILVKLRDRNVTLIDDLRGDQYILGLIEGIISKALISE